LNFLKFIFNIYVSKLFINTKINYFEVKKIKILMKNKLNLITKQAFNPLFLLVTNKVVDHTSIKSVHLAHVWLRKNNKQTNIKS